jgi:hypothetical protein
MPHLDLSKKKTVGISIVIEHTKTTESNKSLCMWWYITLVSALNTCVFAVQRSETQVVSAVNSLPLQIKSNLNKGSTVLFIPNSISWLAKHLDWKENSLYVYANRYVNSFHSVSRSTLPCVRLCNPEWQKFHGFCSPSTVVSLSLCCYRTS